MEGFAADSCALVEGCGAAPGTRRRLRFDTTTPNYGTADLYFGNPSGVPLFHYSECHQSVPTDACTKGEDGPGRECGWAVGANLECTPGATVTVECEGGCDGSCEWDSMLRVCAGVDNACFQGDALADVDDTAECGYCSWAAFTCPAEAAVTVLTGSYHSDDGPAVCTPVTR